MGSFYRDTASKENRYGTFPGSLMVTAPFLHRFLVDGLRPLFSNTRAKSINDNPGVSELLTLRHSIERRKINR